MNDRHLLLETVILNYLDSDLKDLIKYKKAIPGLLELDLNSDDIQEAALLIKGKVSDMTAKLSKDDIIKRIDSFNKDGMNSYTRICRDIEVINKYLDKIKKDAG